MIIQQKISAVEKMMYRGVLYHVMASEKWFLDIVNVIMELMMMEKIILVVNVIILGYIFYFVFFKLVQKKMEILIVVQEF